MLQTHRLVIGKSDSPTPTLSSRLTFLTLAPAWREPYSIATKEMLPQLRESTVFVAENDYTVYNAHGRSVNPVSVDWWAVSVQHFRFTIRQNPGRGNALGIIIFRSANPCEVFLHSTSGSKDFAWPYRVLGRGCLRMERPLQLATYLLGPGNTRAARPTDAECAAAPVCPLAPGADVRALRQLCGRRGTTAFLRRRVRAGRIFAPAVVRPLIELA